MSGADPGFCKRGGAKYLGQLYVGAAHERGAAGPEPVGGRCVSPRNDKALPK